MGKETDVADIQNQVFNRPKGAAVRGPPAPMDRDLYKQTMQRTLQEYMIIWI
jgi:tRNA U34 5-carboxymethylaminomethyl modifying enzyme MnmG/GidA